MEMVKRTSKTMKMKLTEAEQIMRYIEKRGFKLIENKIYSKSDDYFFKKGKIMVGIKE